MTSLNGYRSFQELKQQLAEQAKLKLNKKYKVISEFDIVIAPMAYQANPITIMTHFKVQAAPGMPKSVQQCQIILPEQDLLALQQMLESQNR